jgi:putative tricarboxylic transport membrane protein
VSEQPRGESEVEGSGRLILRLTALAVLLVGGLALYETLRLAGANGLGTRGPAFFPLIITAGLLLFGILFLLRATLWPDPSLLEQSASEEARTSWVTVGLLALALLVYPFVLEPLGYVIATSIFFPVAARILGSERLWRDVAVGFGLSVVIFIGFTQFLGVRLPGGIFELLL